MRLVGALPENTISNLTSLRTLSLRFNSLSGPIPANFFSSLTSLRNIYLQNNSFSDEIPDSLFGLTSLVRLNLGNNNFSGEISNSFNNLRRLGTLYLQNNHFSGRLPDLTLSNLVQFDVSNNNLTGRIPEAISGPFPRTSFTGNSLCGAPLDPCVIHRRGNRLSGGAIAGIVIGSVLVLLLILLLLFCLIRLLIGKDKKTSDSKENEIGILGDDAVGRNAVIPGGGGGGDCGATTTLAAAGIRENEKIEGTVGGCGGKKALIFFGSSGWNFDLEELLRASAEVLGKGTFGTTYKAVLETGVSVAVKRLREAKLGEKDFIAKMEEIGGVNHENLVPVKAYYFGNAEKLLVFDYLPFGSLSVMLHGNKGGRRTPLTWDTRLSIAAGAARGIAHLHSQNPSFSHGNFKSSNVLLTKSYEARVSDFALCQVAIPTAASAPARVAGYRAPEVTDSQKISQKADVYSFGVLLLELLTGKAPMNSLLNEEGVDLPRWVQSVVREEWAAEVFDVELLRYQNVEDDMVQLLQLGIDCTSQFPDNRPPMAEVSARIESLARRSTQSLNADIEEIGGPSAN